LKVEFNIEEVKSKKIIEWHDRCLLGNRLQVMISTGAPLAHHVAKFLFRIIGKIIINGYGTTETGGLVTNGMINRGNGIEIRLRDVEHLNYRTSDKPYPRGEILAHTPKLNHGNGGYFSRKRYLSQLLNRGGKEESIENGEMKKARNDEEEESKGSDEEEEEEEESEFVTLGGVTYFRTGDIGEMMGNGEIRIIDRCKSCFKLSQGVFIAPQPLENAFLESKLVQQVFIWGSVSV
jgi:fatty acid CoA ligase FadD9